MKKYIAVFLGGIVIVLIGLFAKDKFIRSGSAVSGTIHFDRLKPDPGDKGEIVILSRTYQSEEKYIETGVSAPLGNDVPWSWIKAENGKNYDVVAQLRIDGKVVKVSDNVVVTAPAKDQVLTVSVTWDDLPDYVVKDQKVTMSGEIKVDGYIPQGSILDVQVKTDTDKAYVSKWNLQSPKSMNEWTWDGAIPKTKYQMKAVLSQNGKTIGESLVRSEQGLKSSDINFDIISSSKITEPTKSPNATEAPTQKTLIKGNLTINGSLNSNTIAVISWSLPGQSKWTEMTKIPNPKNGLQSWEWTGAKPGTPYDVIAFLQVNEKNVANSQIKTITAPATEVNFIINTGVNVQTPTNRPSMLSCTNNSQGQWDANLTIPVNSSYGNYWLQAGSVQGGIDMYNGKSKPSANDNVVRFTVRVYESRSYFARYSYALCSDCSSDVNFSNFSDSLQFNCGNLPNPTSAPTVAPPTAKPNPTSAPTAVPSTTIPPNTAQCNENCGSNGYNCVLGLQCVSGENDGENVCRNPNCTDRTNCNCN
jgi:hypothetical protein